MRRYLLIFIYTGMQYTKTQAIIFVVGEKDALRDPFPVSLLKAWDES